MKPCKSSDSRKCSGTLTSLPSDDREDNKVTIQEEEDPNSWENVSQGGVGSENPENPSSDPGRISFLTVPSNESSRRPSTADVVIEKLKVEKEDEGGLTISGVALGANCHLSLIIFGTFFILAGIVLSYVGFAPPSGNVSTAGGEEVKVQASSGGTPDEAFQPTENHYQMRIIGPIFLTGGMLMILVGISLYAISRKISKDDMERRLILSTAQLEQLENDFSSQSQSHIIPSPLHTSAPAQNQIYPILSLRRGSLWMEPTPVEHPQTPSEALIISDISSTFPYGIRSVSPLLNNNMALSHQASHYSQHDQLHNLQSSCPPFQSLSARRLSTPFVNIFYGENEGAADIATFPNEDCGASCFPGRVFSSEQSNLQIPKKKSADKGTKSDHLPQVFEVVEASSENVSIVSSDEIKNVNFENAQPIVTSSTLSVSKVPEIQVTGPSPRNLSATSNTSLTSNLDTTSNVLPRLSRHSIGRADSGYPSRPGTSNSNKYQTFQQDR